MTYDCVVIGAGVVGSLIARSLSRFNISVLVVDRALDICSMQSKANTAIIHQGFDPKPGTLKAKMNTEGFKCFSKLTRELGVPFIRTGALVVSTGDKSTLEELVQRAKKNNCAPVAILGKRGTFHIEPNLSRDIRSSLYAPFSGVIDPFLLCIRACECAYGNGVQFSFLTNVLDFKKNEDNTWTIITNKSEIRTKVIINAAGIYSDELNNKVNLKKYHHTPLKGDYMILSSAGKPLVRHTIFSLPSEKGKGVTVCPTTNSAFLLGPTSQKVDDKEFTKVTAGGLEEIKLKSAQMVQGINYNLVMRTFAGVRSHEDGGDFVIEEAQGVSGFITLCGIESPGLTASPAIADYVVEYIVPRFLKMAEKKDFNPVVEPAVEFNKLNKRNKKSLISKNPKYTNIICKCMNITEAEIIDSITRPLGAKDAEGVKKRVRSSMGVCQGGYCIPRINDILKRTLEAKND